MIHPEIWVLMWWLLASPLSVFVCLITFSFLSSLSPSLALWGFWGCYVSTHTCLHLPQDLCTCYQPLSVNLTCLQLTPLEARNTPPPAPTTLPCYTHPS